MIADPMEVEMFEELTTIRISGRCFPPQTDLDIFVKKSGNKARPRISLIFGRNGSGKTTLSETLRKQSLGHHLEDIADLQLLDGDGNQIPNMDEALLKVKVFNEKYVDEKLRVEGDGLGSIVMLGDAGNIKDEIEKKDSAKGDSDGGTQDPRNPAREKREPGGRAVPRLLESKTTCRT